MNPKITVLMPVYNGEEYLRDAIKSILYQTFKDFELLIINDGSSDQSEEIIKSFIDHRIHLIKNERNLGMVDTLNIGIKEARGKYIARMDQDDISLPSRLKKQYDFMENNPEIGISGSWVKKIGKKKNFISKYYTEHNELSAYLLFGTPFAHPTIIMRKAIIEPNNLFYNPEYKNAEDIELWSRAFAVTKITNFPEVLLYYRSHSKSTSQQTPDERSNAATKIKLKLLNKLNLNPTFEELKIHTSPYKLINLPEKELDKFENWFRKIADANDRIVLFDKKSLNTILANRWFLLCYINSTMGLKSWQKFWQSKLSKNFSWKKEWQMLVKFLINCLVKK